MFFSRISTFFAAVIGLTRAGIPYEDVKVKIFDSESTNFEDELYKAMEDNSKYLDTSGFKGAAMEAGKTAIGTVPVIGDVGALFLTLSGLLEDGSDWKRTFARAIVDGSDKTNLENDIVNIKGKMKSIRESLTNDEDLELGVVAWSTRKDIDFVMNIFATPKSLFKKYPLLGAPILIDMAHFIASLIPEINNRDISCKIRNILTAYRKHTVDARFYQITTEWNRLNAEKMGLHYDIGLIRSRVMSLDYNKNGYNSTNELPCEKFTKSNSLPSWTYYMNDKFNEKYYYGVYRSSSEGYPYSGPSMDNPFEHPLIVVAQKFGLFDAEYKNLPDELKCAVDYYSFVRHSVEQLFPVEWFNAYCGSEDSQKPTGHGYLTIKFKHGSFVIAHGGYGVETGGNHPYIELSMYNQKTSHWELKWTSKPSLSACYQCDFNKEFHSDKMDKNTKLRIEVWDEDWGRGDSINSDDLIIDGKDIEGTVDEFSKNGLFFLRNYRKSINQFNGIFNYIETVSFWEDEYDSKPIAERFSRKSQQ